MAETAAQQPPGRRHLATVGDVMRPPLTTVDQNDHVAAAAYLMKRTEPASVKASAIPPNLGA